MQTIKCGIINQNTVVLFDDPDNLPVGQYSAWNKYQLIDSNIGSSLADFTEKHLKILYSIAGDKDKTTEGLNNLRQLFNFILEDISPNQLSFACLVHSINKQVFTDYSETGLRDIVQQLSLVGFSQKSLKKKQLKSGNIFTNRLTRCFRRYIQIPTRKRNSIHSN